MSEQRLGIVGCGKRSRVLISQIYLVKARNYLFCEHPLDHPESAYDAHAESIPEWVVDVKRLRPRITALVDPNEVQRIQTRELCEKNGDSPEEYSSLDDFLANGDFTAVVIATDNYAHVEALLPVLERGLDVYCEKPVVTRLEDHDVVMEHEKRSSGTLFVGFNLRSSPRFKKIKELVDSGSIGRLGTISAAEVRAPLVNGFRYSRERSGGSILEKVCHDLDLLSWYADSDPVKVTAFGGRHVLTRDTDILDHANILIEYENGIRATLELCLYAPWGYGRRYELRGSDGMIRLGDALERVTRSERTSYDLKLVGGHGGADFPQMHHFLTSLRGEGAPLAGMADAKRAAAIAVAAETSVRLGGAIVRIDAAYNVHPA